MPLIAHSIKFAELCPEIARCVVSTDSDEIASIARAQGGIIPFVRPGELAQDDTPMWPVLQHALREMEERDACKYESLLLLDPTSPGRMPEDFRRAIQLLEADPGSVGAVTASEPHFNPRWVCIELQDGYIRPSFPDAETYTRRQDVPLVYRINGALYLWRRDYVLSSNAPNICTQPHRMVLIPEDQAIHIDTIQDFNLAEMLIRGGLIQLPWL
jgi:N-acylneuraminate cytidylyltransferase